MTLNIVMMLMGWPYDNEDDNEDKDDYDDDDSKKNYRLMRVLFD